MSLKSLTDRSYSISKHEECTPIFSSEEEMKRSLSRLCYGNLHVIGSLWVEGMKSVLTGSKMCLVPTVHAAAKKEEPPKKPPKMKYKELPLYECPHYEYKQHLENEYYKCLGENKKILQQIALPTVASWKKSTCNNIRDFNAFIKECVCEMGQMIKRQKNCFVRCMRCDNNINMRRLVVGLGTAAGFIISSRRTPLIYQRVFWTAVGALSTGALCFPKETDENFRYVCGEIEKLILKLDDIWVGGAPIPFVAPCEKDLPPCPPKRKVQSKHLCKKRTPPKKKK